MAGMQISGLASGMDTDSIIQDLMKVEKAKIDKVDRQKLALEMKKEVWEEMNTKLYSFYTKNVFDLKSSGTFKTKSASSSNEAQLGVTANSSAAAGSHNIEVTTLAQGSHLYSDAITDDTVKIATAGSFTLADGTGATATLDLDANASIADLIKKINDSDLKIEASYDSVNKRILMNSTNMGASSNIQLTGVDAGDEATFMTAIGLTNGTSTNHTIGTDAAYEYNGMSLTASSNQVTVNGLSLTLKATTTSAITVNVTNNTDAVYNKIKDFVKAYNELQKEMDTKYSAEAATGYDPLTDEEKESLEQSVIDKWEAKIKTAILRRDNTLSGLSRIMRSVVTYSSGVDTAALPEGFRILSDVGIVTGGYTEKGQLHILGDADDSLYSIKENKLKKALEEDPEKVAELFTAIGQELYSTMTDKMKSTTLNSALTLYNDKQINKQITDYETRIADLEDRMDAIEDRYTKQFAAMEQAIQRANAQSQSLMGMLGGSS